MKRASFVLFFISVATLRVHAQTPCPSPIPPRPIAIISDLHLGPGMSAATAAYEDFRWPHALSAFLHELNPRLGPNVDLVIAGDLFEWWQHPTVECAGADADHGCTIAEMVDIATTTIKAHKEELHEIGRFATAAGNSVYVVPGNHDAALMIDEVWDTVRPAFGSDQAHVTRVSAGRWYSCDDRVAVEHGPQIGRDVNRFPEWPNVTSSKNGSQYVWRPWGEAFVADQFNRIEKTYPLIDNVLPLTAGLKLYLDEHSVVANGGDVAKFLAFNIFRTSLRQKVALRINSDGSAQMAWNIQNARRLGHRLVASAMPDDDLDRAKLLASDEQVWKDARVALDESLLSNDSASPEEIASLCDIASGNAHSQDAAAHPIPRVECSTELLIAGAMALIPERRQLAAHISEIQKTHPRVRYFVYGHTHQYRAPFPVRPESGIPTLVMNDGAFQRLVSLETLLVVHEKEERKKPAAERSQEKSTALRTALESLPPCYNVVLIPYDKGIPKPDVWSWLFAENARMGGFYRADAPECVLGSGR